MGGGGTGSGSLDRRVKDPDPHPPRRSRTAHKHPGEGPITATTTPRSEQLTAAELEGVHASREGWNLLLGQVWAQRKGVGLGIFVGLMWTSGKVAVPKLVQLAIDGGIEVQDGAAILKWALVIGLAAAVAAVFTGLRRYTAFREARWAEASLRDRLYTHIQRLHFAFHDRTATGQLMSRGNTDLQQLQAAVVLIPLTVANAATAVVVSVVLIWTNPLLALLALGALPFVNIFAKRFATRLHPTMVGVQQESAEVAEVVEESVAGVRVVKGFGAEDIQRRRLRDEADDLYGVAMRAARIRSRYWPILELLPNLGLVAVLAYGGHLVLDGQLQVGELVLFNSYVLLLIWPLRMLGMIVSVAQRAAASAQRVHEVLATAPVIVEDDHPRPLSPGGGEVTFSDVTFGYGDGPTVLEGFDLTIEAGESVALVGATASGKSTVAKLVPRFYDPQSGTVAIDGCDVAVTQLADVRQAVGLVFEETFLFSDSLAANIAFAKPDASAEEIERAARLAGAHEFISALPEGYGTELGERGFSLSGGQRQRVAIARAILADPRVLILDDATSAVDPSKEHEIRDALGTVMEGRTTIVIAHRPATIALADRVVLIEGGRVAATGTHQELLAGDRRYRRTVAATILDEDPQASHRSGDDPGSTLAEVTGGLD